MISHSYDYMPFHILTYCLCFNGRPIYLFHFFSLPNLHMELLIFSDLMSGWLRSLDGMQIITSDNAEPQKRGRGLSFTEVET